MLAATIAKILAPYITETVSVVATAGVLAVVRFFEKRKLTREMKRQAK